MNVTETTFRNINHQALQQEKVDSEPEKICEKYSVKSERLNESRFAGIKPLWMRQAINTVCEHPGTVAIAAGVVLCVVLLSLLCDNRGSIDVLL